MTKKRANDKKTETPILNGFLNNIPFSFALFIIRPVCHFAHLTSISFSWDVLYVNRSLIAS